MVITLIMGTLRSNKTLSKVHGGSSLKLDVESHPLTVSFVHINIVQTLKGLGNFPGICGIT